MYSLFTWARGVLPVLLVGLLVVVAVGCDGLGGVESGMETDLSRPDQSTASKLVLPAIDEAGVYLEALEPENSSVRQNGVDIEVTRFRYLARVPTPGTKIALEAPSCASYVAASGAQSNANPNGSIEWNSGIPTEGTAEIWYAFLGHDVPGGAVGVSVKSESNDIQELGVINGPCKGRIHVEGQVYMNVGGEGIAGVQVDVTEDGETMVFPDGPLTTGLDGIYRFDTIAPWWSANPVTYAFSLPTDANSFLLGHDSFFTYVPCVSDSDESCTPPAKTVDVTIGDQSPQNVDGPDWAFEINIKKALEQFDSGTTLSDGFPRTVWRVNATQKGTPKYQPMFSQDEVVDFANENVTHLRGHFGEPIVLDDIIALVQNSSNNDEYEALRTSALTLALNIGADRGLCSDASQGLSEPTAEELSDEDLLNDFPVCNSGVDLDATLLVLDQAIGELDNLLTPGKARSGTTKSVVDCTNNDC